MWQRFTERARKCVFYAQEEAQKLGEGFVSTEHVLLGLLREECTATRILQSMGVDPRRVEKDVYKIFPTPSPTRPNTDMSLTPRAKRVIDLSYDEAQTMGHDYIGTEHLLLGIVREESGITAKVLKSLGVTIVSARKAALAYIEAHKDKTSSPATATEDVPNRPALRVSYRDAYLGREASFVNLLAGLSQLHFTSEVLLAVCLHDPVVHAKLAVSGIYITELQAILQAVLAEPDEQRFGNESSVTTILEVAEAERIPTGDERLCALHVLAAILVLDSSLAALALKEAGVTLEVLRAK